MARKWRRQALCAATALASVYVSSLPAFAGAFAIREQSTAAQGVSFAGAAAGGQLSSMFWNPATMTQSAGFAWEVGVAGIFPQAHQSPTSATGIGALFPLATTDDFLADAAVPNMYAAWNVSPDLWVGISVNSPFGQVVNLPQNWPGTAFAGSTDLKTYNATPTIAYRISPWLSVGLGLQIQYATAKMNTGPGFAGTNLAGSGWGYGLTAGLTITPAAGTTIGIGWRSQIDQDFEGAWLSSVPGGTVGSASTTLKLPDIVSAGIRHQFNPALTVMGTVEWSNWSRIGTSPIVHAAGVPALVTIGLPAQMPFQYQDGWMFSAGVEYNWLPSTTLRAGLGYEISPITTAVRTPRIPDEDRILLSFGLTHALTPSLKFDLAYTHYFIRTADVVVGPGNPWFDTTGGAFGTYVGTASGHIDIVSGTLRYQFAPPPPPLYTKG
jgi:long-chain fatty acid transport protein